MTEEEQKEVVLRAVEAAIMIRKEGHRYPECVTLGEVAAIIPEVNHSAIVRHMNQLAAELVSLSVWKSWSVSIPCYSTT